jgi:hypothetical protein
VILKLIGKSISPVVYTFCPRAAESSVLESEIVIFWVIALYSFVGICCLVFDQSDDGSNRFL